MGSSFRLAVFSSLLLSLMWSLPAASGGRGGDDFRAVAREYDGQARDVIERATSAKDENAGPYLQLATLLRRMAGIKRSAAALADDDRWDEIDWSEYQEIEVERDRLADQLRSSEASKTGGEPAHDFLSAARDYAAQAEEARYHARETDGVEQAVFEELAGVFEEMARIKYDAASAQRSNADFDWAPYESLAARRDNLLGLLEHAK